MKTVVLNFSSPLQSWAGKAVLKTKVNTKREPSERAIKGLIAAAYGVPRVPHGEKYPDYIESLEINHKIIKPGKTRRDFQTIGTRDGEEIYLNKIGQILNRGKKALNKLESNQQGTTSIVRRTYLEEAQFLVFVRGINDSHTEEVLEKLKNPIFSPYLGKKAFAPSFPFLLGIFESKEGHSYDVADIALEYIEKINQNLNLESKEKINLEISHDIQEGEIS